MKTVLHKKTVGIVLRLESLSEGSDQGPLSAHLILNKRLMDEDGNICLTGPMGFQNVLDVIDSLKSELDSLSNETVLWLAQNIALRRARFSIISNNNFEKLGGAKGGGGYDHGGTPPPNHFRTLSWPTKQNR